MVFSHPNMIKTQGSFTFFENVKASANACLLKPVFADLWQGFSFRLSSINMKETDELVFCIGKADKPALDGNSYALNVETDGVCVAADSEKSLIMGYMTLLDLIYAQDEDTKTALKIDCCTLLETPLIQSRMVHFCVFPETELWEIDRFVRLSGALKYTHIIIEFWGMLKYDCMKELSWKCAFSKEEIRPIVQTAKDLGLEIIPMFNHWGHASAGRVMHGKHVVLDQNPSLQTYFSEDGWCWDIKNPKVRALLLEIRKELTELFGDTEYFHIGCDEAYNYDLSDKDSMDMIVDYLNCIANDMKKIGKRIIVWGDMFLYRYSHYMPENRYACNAPSPESEKYLLGRLSKDIIIADWQYDAAKYPVETTEVFTSAGFDTLVCPWDRSYDKLKSCVDTVKDQNLFGILHTTWHTLSSGMPYVMMAAIGCFETLVKKRYHPSAASLLRKVYFVDGNYEKAGWAKKQIDVIT